MKTRHKCNHLIGLEMEAWEPRKEEEAEGSWWTDPDLLEGMPQMVKATVGRVAGETWVEEMGLFFFLTNKLHDMACCGSN